MVKNKKILVSVTESQYDLWKQKAEEREISLPEFVRRSVEVYLKMLEKYNKSMKKGQ